MFLRHPALIVVRGDVVQLDILNHFAEQENACENNAEEILCFLYSANADRIRNIISYTVPAWHLSFIYQIYDCDRCTMGGCE